MAGSRWRARALLAAGLVVGACGEPEDTGQAEAVEIDPRSLPAAPGPAALQAAPVPAAGAPMPGAPDHRAGDARLEVGCDETGRALLASLGTAFAAEASGSGIAPGLVSRERLVYALRDGRLELAVTTQALAHRERMLGLAEHPLVRIAFMPVVHRENPLANVSRERLQSLLAGDETSWFELVRRHERVVVVSPENDPILQAAIRRFFPGRAVARTIVASDAAAMVDRVARTPAAIALVPAAAVRTLGVRAVTVDGVPATAANVHARRYPLVLEAVVLTRKKPGLRALRFLAFVTGRHGRKAVAALGFPPM